MLETSASPSSKAKTGRLPSPAEPGTNTSTLRVDWTSAIWRSPPAAITDLHAVTEVHCPEKNSKAGLPRVGVLPSPPEAGEAPKEPRTLTWKTNGEDATVIVAPPRVTAPSSYARCYADCSASTENGPPLGSTRCNGIRRLWPPAPPFASPS